jgi:hypothetical protein
MARAESVIGVEWTGDICSIVVKGAGEGGGDATLLFDRTKAHAMTRNVAEQLGWKNRLVDKAAVGRDKATGKPVDPKRKFELVRGLVEHYQSGTEHWAMRVAQEDIASSEWELFVDTLCEVYSDKPRDKLAAWGKSQSLDARKALLASPKFAAIYTRRLAELTKGVSVDSLEGELDSI